MLYVMPPLIQPFLNQCLHLGREASSAPPLCISQPPLYNTFTILSVIHTYAIITIRGDTYGYDHYPGSNGYCTQTLS